MKFNIWKKATEDNLANKVKAMEELNQQFDMAEFMKLDYDEAKEMFNTLKPNLPYDTQRKEVAEALEQLKMKKYPILKVAHYYPVINEMDSLSDESKHKLDEVLFGLRQGSYVTTRSRAWSDLKFSTEMTEKVLEFLYDKGVVEKMYKILCKCGDDGKIISEQSYKDHQKYFELRTGERMKSATDEEIDWMDKFEEDGDRLWSIGCCECDGREIDAMEDLDASKEIKYKIVAAPDMTYSSK